MRSIKILHKKKDRTLTATPTEGFRLLPTQAKFCWKIVASRLSNYCETEELLPEEQGGFRPARSTIDIAHYSSM